MPLFHATSPRKALSRLNRRTGARRWEVSEAELERMDEARSGSLSARTALLLLLRSPRLLPDVGRVVGGAFRGMIFDNNPLLSMLDAERGRRAVPDAAAGVGWYDERPFLEALAPHLRRDVTALELGCGGGRISRQVAPLVRELVCTDVLASMVAEASQNLASYANVTVARADGFALREFRERSFDLVFAQGVLGYMDPNPLLGMLDEVARVLQPGGVCVFNFSTIDHPLDVRWQLDAVREQARRRRFSGGTDRVYTRAQLSAMYEAVGMQVVPAADLSASGSGRVVIVGQRAADSV
jgi:ubiquinone/menaquinone biosynthesis C-methylase UbiE